MLDTIFILEVFNFHHVFLMIPLLFLAISTPVFMILVAIHLVIKSEERRIAKDFLRKGKINHI